MLGNLRGELDSLIADAQRHRDELELIAGVLRSVPDQKIGEQIGSLTEAHRQASRTFRAESDDLVTRLLAAVIRCHPEGRAALIKTLTPTVEELMRREGFEEMR